MTRKPLRRAWRTAANAAAVEVLVPETLEEKFQALESGDKIEALLSEIKSRQAAQSLLGS